eukprot:5687670-Pleurochrysis_carterae.AAC.1
MQSHGGFAPPDRNGDGVSARCPCRCLSLPTVEQVEYAKAMKQIFVALEAFVKEHHRTGLEWNPKGVAFTDFGASGTTL